MREILFRGKRLSDGEWVDGNLFVDEMKDKHEILVGYVNYRVGWGVDPKTVGQFTGLTDKNGTKVFEGDIVSVKLKDSNGECWEETKRVHYNSNECCWYPMRWNEECDFCEGWTEITSIEVIGNIHDNPELLEG